MKRPELEDLREKSMLALKELFLGSLHPEKVLRIHPAQIAASTALHQACCRELNDGLYGYNFDELMNKLTTIEGDLGNLLHTADPEQRQQGTQKAYTMVCQLVNDFWEIADWDDDNEEIPE